MGRMFIFFIPAFLWAITTWREMRRSQSARERGWVARTSLSVWLFLILGVIAFVLLPPPGRLLSVPLFIVVGLGARYGLRRVRARIRAEEGDPLSRARRLN